MCYKQKCKVVSLNLAHPVYRPRPRALKFGEMEFGEMKRDTSNWSNFCMLLRRAGLTASAGLSCLLRDATQSAVMLRQIVRPFVYPSATLRYRDHVG